MKNVLYGSTALVTAGIMTGAAPAFAEEGIKVGIGGYQNNYFVFGDTDSADGTDRGPTGIFSDGEIHFKGETTLDNGITFGLNVQLESFGASGRGGTGDVIDEDYAYVDGSFGRLQVGSENSAAYLMTFAAPIVGAPVNTGWVTTFIPADGANTGGGGFRTPRLSTYLDWNNDENVITYFTPRFSGFQFGATYAPTVSGSGDGANFPVQADEDTEFNNGVSVGVNYVESFNGIDVALSGGFRRATAPDNAGEGGNLVGEDDNLAQYSVGAQFGFAGFTVGGGYANESSGRATDGQAWNVGASYGTGPWTVGVSYFQSEVEGRAQIGDTGTFGSQVGDDELIAINGAISYAIGPGINADAGVLYADLDSGSGGSGESDGVVGYVGLHYSF